MAQSAFKQTKDPDQPLSLVERIDAEFPVGARLSSPKPEPTVSSMAERFAPDTLRAKPDETEPPLSAQPVLPGQVQDPNALGPLDPRQDPKTLDPKTLDPKTLDPKTLDPKTLDPKTLGAETLSAETLSAESLSRPASGFVALLTVVAIAPAAALGAFLWFGTLQTSDNVGGAGSAGAVTSIIDTANSSGAGPEGDALTPEAAALPQDTPAEPQVAQAAIVSPVAVLPKMPEFGLTAPEEILAEAGETVGFTIDIEGAEALPPRSFVSIRDVPEGTTFSSGRPIGQNEWTVGPDEMSGLTMHLAEEQNGTSDLSVELVGADGAVMARTATRLDVAPPPTTGLVVRSGEEDRIAVLMEYGQKMMDVGYLEGARAYYGRAAEAGSGKAAIAVGATYDPEVIATLGVQGAKPDAEAAETWYGRAAGLGIADPQAEIAAFQKAWIEGAEAAAKIHGPAGTKPAPAPAPRAAAQDAAQEEPGSLGGLAAAVGEITASTEWVEVSSPVNVRSGPSSNDEAYKIAAKGTKLRVLSREGNWVQITDPNTQQQGWIYRRFLKVSSAP